MSLFRLANVIGFVQFASSSGMHLNMIGTANTFGMRGGLIKGDTGVLAKHGLLHMRATGMYEFTQVSKSPWVCAVCKFNWNASENGRNC